MVNYRAVTGPVSFSRCTCCLLIVYSQDEYGDIDICNAAFTQVPNELFEIGDATRNFISERFDRHDLNSTINITKIFKNGHLGAHVIHHERIFAELNF